MATPTLAACRAIAVAWWREPGVPSLSVLQARLAGVFTNETRARIGCPRIVDNAGALSLVVELERDGSVVRSVSWTPNAGDRQETLLDVFDPTIGMTHRRRREIDAQPAEPEA